MSDLIIDIKKESALKAYTTDGGLDPFIIEIERLVREFDHDMSTKASRAKTASLAAKVAKFKVYLDSLGKDLVSEWKQKAKVVDSARRDMRDRLDLIKGEARQTLDDWESKESARIAAIKERIEGIKNFSTIDCSDEMREAIEYFEKTPITESFAEFRQEAEEARNLKLDQLKRDLDAQIIKEEQEKELQRQRLELEALRLEKEKRDREEEERQAAERAAKIKAKQEQERKEREARLVREAEEKTKREEDEKRQAEIQKVEREKQAEIEALKKAEADRIAKEREEEARAEAERLAEQRRKTDENYRAMVKHRIVSEMEKFSSMEDLYEAILKNRIDGLEVTL